MTLALIRVWAALVALTALLALLSRLGPVPALAGLLTITPLKAWLVIWNFMQLRQEGPLLRAVLVAVLATLVVFFALLFADAGWR